MPVPSKDSCRVCGGGRLGRAHLAEIPRIFGTLSSEFQHLLANLCSSWIRGFELLSSFKSDNFLNTCQGRETREREASAFYSLPQPTQTLAQLGTGLGLVTSGSLEAWPLGGTKMGHLTILSRFRLIALLTVCSILSCGSSSCN